MNTDLGLTVFLAISAVVMITELLRRRIVLRGALLSAVGGMASLGLVSALSGTFSLGVTMSAYSAAAAIIYGLPGVVGMLVLRMML